MISSKPYFNLGVIFMKTVTWKETVWNVAVESLTTPPSDSKTDIIRSPSRFREYFDQ
jgi:hypothetical protein